MAMKMSVSAKRCPGCGKAAMLEATFCPACGHQFRTKFVQSPLERTQAFVLPPVPGAAPRPAPTTGAAKTFRLAFFGAFLAVSLGGGLLCFGWNASPTAVKPQSTTPQRVADTPVQADRAMRLYRTLGPAMSLYEVDQAAGGTGRIIPASDPHRLLLSYDYSNRSVRVSLSRDDVDSGDYRVRDVSLYQGSTLLQRHAETE